MAAASFSERPTGTEIAKRAWNSTIAGVRAMPMLFLGAALGAVFVAGVLAILAYVARPLASNVLVELGNILAWSALGAPVAVAMHRYILLGEATPGFLSYAPPHTRVFFLWLLALQVLGGILNAAGRLNGLIAVIALAAFVIASVNLAMVFPAIAIDVPHRDWQSRMRQSWEMMQGRFWLFIRAGVIAFLPVVGVWILAVAVMAVLGLIARATGFPPLVWFAGLWVSVAVGVMMIFAIAMGAAIASWMYGWVRDPQAQSAQTATSTVT